jgi:hypothetical protein
MKFINLEEQNSFATPSPLSSQIKLAIESEQCSQELVSGQQDDDRALEIAQAIEDLHVVVKSTDAPTAVQTTLLKTVANTAVAGTYLDASEFIPALESMSSPSVLISSLLDRVGMILNSYVHGISGTFFNLSKYIKTNLALIRENGAIIDSFFKKFPKPDKAEDDIARTVIFDADDQLFMMTPVGVVNTYGDLLNWFRNTRRACKQTMDVTMIVNSRLLDAIRQIIPSSNIDTADKLYNQVMTSNSNLALNITEMWQTSVGKSELKPGSGDDGQDAFESSGLLGNKKYVLSVKRINLQPGAKMSAQEQSEYIRSFAFKMQTNQNTEAIEEQLKLSGVTNAGVGLLILEIKNFIVDLERYAVWCQTTADMVSSQATSDIVNINKYFKTSCADGMSQEEADQLRAVVQSHILDIQATVKTMITTSCGPIAYCNELLNAMIMVINKMPEETPVGSYSLQK